MKGRWQALSALSWHEWVRLGEAWAVLLATYVGLRLLPFQAVRTLAQARPGHRRSPDAGEAAAAVEDVQRAVKRAAQHHLVPVHCLVKALASQWLLGRRGIVASLQFGVRRTPEGLAAHAWLELEGRPIGETLPIEARFARLAAPGPGA
jgi:hypothetical protein